MFKASLAMAAAGLILIGLSFAPGIPGAATASPGQQAGGNQTPAQAQASPAGDPAYGKALFMDKGCTKCHYHASVASQAASDTTGAYGAPDLSNYRGNSAFLHAWLKDPKSVRPATQMPTLGLSDMEIEALAAFLGARATPLVGALRGPGLQGEIAISNPEALDRLDPRTLTDPHWGHLVKPATGEGYEITRYYLLEDGSRSSLTRFVYYPDPLGRAGKIYYAGQDANVPEGDRWALATQRGEALIQSVLKGAGIKEAAPAAGLRVDPVPARIVKGTPVKLGFSVPEGKRQGLRDNLIAYFHSGEPYQMRVLLASAQGEAGHYVVELNLPLTGDWNGVVVVSPELGAVALPDITVED